MAIIYSYPTAVPKLIDKIIITQSYDANAAAPIEGNPTRAALISDIVDLTGVTSGTANTLPIFTGTGLANSVIRQDISGIVYIGPEDNVRFTGTSVNAPALIGTDLYITNIYGSNGGLLNIQGNSTIGNAVTDTLTVNSVSTFNADVTVDGGDIEVEDENKGLILHSPNNTRYRITVANDGTLSTAAV